MEKYVPDMYQESIFKVNYEMLKQKGIKCLLFDLDNTIVPYNVKEANEELKDFFDNLKKDFKVIIFSNSSTRRLKVFSSYLDVDFVSNAKKPSIKSFLLIFKKHKFTEDEVAIIGDQLLTDIKGGNNTGIMTVLVNPVSSYDPIWTRPSRFIEKRIKEKLRKRNLFKGRFYDEKV